MIFMLSNVKNILKIKYFAYLPTLKNIQMFPETRHLFFLPNNKDSNNKDKDVLQLYCYDAARFELHVPRNTCYPIEY